MMDLMHFQKQLQNRNIPQQEAYMFAMIYEQMIEMSKQLDLAATVVGQLVNTVNNFVALHESTQGQVKELMRRGRPDGVEVESVLNDPEDTKQ